MTLRRLRVEERRPTVAVEDAPAVPVQPDFGVEHWKRLALQTAERLSYAETANKDLRVAADELRSRQTKYKTRLDNAQERVNELQRDLVRVSDDRDRLHAEMTAMQAAVEGTLAKAHAAADAHEAARVALKRKLWDLFTEL